MSSRDGIVTKMFDSGPDVRLVRLYPGNVCQQWVSAVQNRPVMCVGISKNFLIFRFRGIIDI
jgi:hypothetical protein